MVNAATNQNQTTKARNTRIKTIVQKFAESDPMDYLKSLALNVNYYAA